MNYTVLNDSVNIENIIYLEKIIGDGKLCLILEKYIEVGTETISKLCKASDDQNINIITRFSHSLQSSSMQIGAEKLSSLCKKLEDESRELDYSIDNELITAIEKEFNIVISDIEKIIAQTSNDESIAAS